MNDQPPRRRAATYLWTADGQDAEPSLLDQRTLLAAFAAAQGLDIVAEFADRGGEPTTGFATRQGLIALVAAASRGNFAVALAEDAHKVSADPLQSELVLHELQNAGIEFLAASSTEALTEQPGDAMTLRIRDVLAAATDFGAHDAIAALRVARPRMSEAARVRNEIQRMRQRKINFTSVARRLNDMGLRAPDGAPWTRLSAFDFARGL